MPVPELVLHRAKPRCKISIILLDWAVRESFHSLQYLNEQTADRDDYEIIWLEFYRRKPHRLQEMVFGGGEQAPLIDQWIVAGYDDETIFSKHRLYNLGILAAQGEYCVICDSDAIFTPTFVAKLLNAFAQSPRAVIHLDEIRNDDQRFYPFAFPAIGDILGPGCINWNGTISRGLDDSPDRIHDANYGACMAAPRAELLAIGGADEHSDYLGYICGPYDMTFRLANHGVRERWLRDEYLYHVWHPNVGGLNTDYKGPSDGRGMSLRSLEARASGRVMASLENPWIRAARQGRRFTIHELMTELAARAEPAWRPGNQESATDVLFLEHNYQGFNVFLHRQRWYAVRVQEGLYDPRKARRYRPLLEAEDEPHLKHIINHYAQLPSQWWRRIRTQPLYRLPWRAARRIGKELSRIF